MEEKENKTMSFLERMRAKAESQTHYGGEAYASEARMEATTCPNCGAGRAKMDGLTKCAYCGFEFVKVELTDGVNIKKEDNSR